MKKLLKAFALFFLAASVMGILAYLRKFQKPCFHKEPIDELKKEFHTEPIKKKKVFQHDLGLKSKKVVIGWIAVLLVTISGSEMFLQPFASFLKTSLLYVEDVEFEGTTMPVKKVPNWVNLTTSEYRAHYDSIPSSKLIPLPPYNEALIKKGKNSKWGENDRERNMYITYSVLHMGDYKLEANHDTGSHIGVDFKLPIGTPIYAIANGVVEKVENKKTGFGKSILLKHPNVPINNNPNNTETLYSTYAHLSQTLLTPGQKVKKGDLIGKSGNTGNATAAHLHFQVERESAPFHPYWPFTWADQQAAGLSYFEAINQGLNKENGYKYTLHPMELIVDYQDYQGATLVQSENEQATVTAVETKVEETRIQTKKPEEIIPEKKEDVVVVREEEPTPNTETTQEPTRRSVVMTNKGDPDGIIIETDRSFIPGNSEIVRIRLEDENLIVSNGIQLNTTLRHLAQVQPSLLKEKHFKNGIAEVVVNTDSDSTFRLIAEGDFGQIKSDSLRAYIFTDIPRAHQYGDAIKYLKDNQIVNGYGDGTFRPENTLNRAEAVKILLVGNNIPVKNNPNPFNDITAGAWFEDFVTTASSQGIVKGYEDGSFKPDRTISRAEFLKVALESANITLPKEGDNYKDIPEGAWFENYFRVAKRYNLLPTSSGNVDPGKAITRGEAAFIMYKVVEMD